MPLPEPNPTAPPLEFLGRLEVVLHPNKEIGPRQRRIIPIIGGTVSGKITRKILNTGLDWQSIFADGGAELDTRFGNG